MRNETNLAGDAKSIPVQWPANYAFRSEDSLAILSLIVFLLVPLLAVLLKFTHAYGGSESAAMREQLTTPQSCEFAFAFLVVGVPVVLAIKYLWLFCMCRFLDRASVGPLVAYGIPRRISAFDRQLVARIYRSPGSAPETRLVPQVSAARLFWYLPATFVIAALVSFGVAYFRLVTNEPRFWNNGFACAFMALFTGTIAEWGRRSQR